jgi:hypothetical protein
MNASGEQGINAPGLSDADGVMEPGPKGPIKTYFGLGSVG